jgi:hypothetical protein
MMLVITRRRQGVAGAGLGLLGQVVESVFQVVKLLPLFPCLPALNVPLISLE